MGCLKDDLAVWKGKLVVLDTAPAKVAEAVLERDHWRSEHSTIKKKNKLSQEEVALMKKTLEIHNKELEDMRRQLDEKTREAEEQAKCADKSANVLLELETKYQKLCEDFGHLQKNNAEMSRDLATEKEKVVQAEDAKRLLLIEVAKCSSLTIQRFLGSDAFESAAMVSVLDVMKFAMYEQLKDLGEIYSFVPEQVGFLPIEKEQAKPKSLIGYGWETVQDRLIDPKGKLVPGKLTLRGCDPKGIVYVWDKEKWPRDVRVLETPVDDTPEIPMDQDLLETSTRHDGLETILNKE